MVIHFENAFITDRAMVCTRWFGCNALLAYRNYLRYGLEEITSANVTEFIEDPIQ